MVFPGWTLLRGIPSETYVGLLTGQYKIYGGVIRWAKGTPNAGQIIRHLIPVPLSPFDMMPGLDFIPGIIANVQLEQLKGMTRFNTYQLMQLSNQVYTLSQSTQQILQIATGTAFLSGLGLVVSSIGFVALNKKLNTIDSRLKEVQKDVQAIKYFLESSERAKLFAALNALLKIDLNTAPEHKHMILHTARNTLAEINMRYRELLAEANTIETAMAHEEYFTLTSLAQVRCTAELGMLDFAYKEIEEMNAFWQLQSVRIAREIIMGKYPERFLATDFVSDVPVTELAEWLDFTYAENKGLSWIDELRLKINEPWYSKSWFASGGSGLNQNVGIGLEKEQGMLIPALRKLISRSSVFEGYVAHYQLFQQQNITPLEFERKVASLPEKVSVNGYIIMNPATPSQLQQSA